MTGWFETFGYFVFTPIPVIAIIFHWIFKMIITQKDIDNLDCKQIYLYFSRRNQK